MTEKEVSNALEAAINQAVIDNQGYEPGDLLIDWVVVAFVANPDQETGNGYPMFFPNGDVPTYRARGLLTTALMKLEDE